MLVPTFLTCVGGFVSFQKIFCENHSNRHLAQTKSETRYWRISMLCKENDLSDEPSRQNCAKHLRSERSTSTTGEPRMPLTSRCVSCLRQRECASSPELMLHCRAPAQ